ncbi:MAG: replication factor C large subunit [Desulfurococcales archaeon]|nr:replication factor C large subunit [Desulfurococcales archaeon]
MIRARAARALPWVIKYRPKRIDDVVDQDKAKNILIPWVKSWLEGRIPEKRAALLYGPPGVGKTSLVEAIANEYDLEVLELNASDYRRRSDIERIVGVAARRRSMFKRGVIILLDEVDGINPREDAGGVEALVNVIRETRNPIVMTANDPWKDHLRPLRELSLLVEFKALTVNQIVGLLQRICRAEGIECDREALRFIAERSEGDVRAAINDLQAVAEGYGKVTASIVRMVVRGREKSVEIWKTLSEVYYYPRYAWKVKKAVQQSEKDYEELIAWLNDNTPRKYEHPADIWRALDALSRATLFLSRAKYGGEWSLLSYVFDLMGPGVAFARQDGGVSRARYGYPERIKLLAQMREVREVRERIAEILSRRLLTSKSTVKREVLPLIIALYRESRDTPRLAALALSYGFDEKMVGYLAGPRKAEILRAMQRLKKLRAEERAKATEARTERVEARRPGREEKPRGPVGLDFFLGGGRGRRGRRR